MGFFPGAVEFFEYKDCFDAFHIYPMFFIVRVENKIGIVNITCFALEHNVIKSVSRLKYSGHIKINTLFSAMEFN